MASPSNSGDSGDSVEPSLTPPPETPNPAFNKKPKRLMSVPRKRDIPQGVWDKCPKCENMLFEQELKEALKVCTHCDHHFSIGAYERIESLVIKESFEEMDEGMTSVDSLEFTGTSSYASKLERHRQKTKLNDAVITGWCQMGDWRVGLAVMDFNFLGGSMGSVVGEKITRLVERSTKEKVPAIIVSSSGGARMYEGMFSLMQMAKTSAALAYHGRKGLAYISVLTHPTTAGVMASYASLGDLIISEPKAMIGFAGPRVIRDTTQSELPKGFQTAEFLMERGLIDAIIPRCQLRERLEEYLDYMCVRGA